MAKTKATKKRPSWDEYFSRIVVEVSKRATCLRRQVGAILVNEKRMLSTGYNGAPSGIVHCSKRRCLREAHGVPSGERHELCRGLHAEMNAIIQAATYGVNINGSTLYSTTFPCSLCAKMLINAGIIRIVAQGDYADALAKEMLSEAGVKLELYDVTKHKTVPFPSSRRKKSPRSKKKAILKKAKITRNMP